ncbi:PhzF family phenazine biosynthesis protein [Pseudochrobactrum algeriensis]|uniref:PhzF family phenazine biosynthesis protein n=1 Tax=Pseudochrobactrum algeriensis TaxID=2834768 RepID=UPI001BCB46F1|nr:PhzF family phenazine biosynthesis protein [Pseudochrobactrum algeriensis]QVQ35849.1 PhzF family phenazine biosynthesis protein [Pseudochrobactrum algeriensis]QVQ39065.1 PhzF family phenazine biosynthesis protein [Pseudochrobactrum algeriensis]QVQ42984.1 PhzF family phenazine biosynthesis protein [Pseudochrobactrum algeriensis]
MNGMAVQGRFYEIYDVFTEKALNGNPLAIVHDSEGLDDATMLAIAREFNLSETVFVAPAVNPLHTASIRIFTPDYELNFAGHPTVGTAVALAYKNCNGQKPQTDLIMTLEEKVGPVRVAVHCAGSGDTEGPSAAFAEFDLPRLPERVNITVEKEQAAAALRLNTHEIGFENHVPSVWSGGKPFVLVPVKNMIAAAKVVVDPVFVEDHMQAFEGRAIPFYIYTRETRLFESNYHARMFTSGKHVYEDPATGSAVAAFAGAINEFDQPVDGLTQLWIEQGIQMGRPSRIRLELDVAAKKLTGARIGGSAVKVAEGYLKI